MIFQQSKVSSMSVAFAVILCCVVGFSTFAQQADDLVFISKDQAERIAAILRNDILKAFDLERTYDSDLKRRRFFESAEGKTLRDSLQSLRKQVISQIYEIQLKTNVGDFDLAKKGFTVLLDEQTFGWATAQANEEAYQEYKSESNVLEGIYFPSVPLKASKTWLGASAAKFLFIKCSETVAERIEKTEVVLHFIFGLKGDTKRVKKLFLFSNEDYYYPTAKNVKLRCEADGELVIETSFK